MEYEPDQRHADLVIEQAGVSHCKPVNTPCCSEAEYDEAKRLESEYLRGEEATLYRGIAARLNYLALDRSDIQYCAKEIAKHMARPTALDWAKIKRAARYLAGAPRYVQRYEWQEYDGTMQAYADSDWAGDRVTRKSTSGGIIMMGRHMIKSWSSSQPVVALSSGEAELYALVKAATQAKGLTSLLWDYGQEVDTTVHTDSTAALGIVHRKGLGKTRHIEVQYVWVQEKVHKNEISVQKIGTKYNPADMLTKGLKRELLDEHVSFVGGHVCGSRDKSALTLNAVGQSDKWELRNDAVLVRAHAKPRECLFTPMKVAGGPKVGNKIGRTRVTFGQFEDGEKFTMRDDWKKSDEPHRRLRSAWTGYTVFLMEEA